MYVESILKLAHFFKKFADENQDKSSPPGSRVIGLLFSAILTEKGGNLIRNEKIKHDVVRGNIKKIEETLNSEFKKDEANFNKWATENNIDSSVVEQISLKIKEIKDSFVLSISSPKPKRGEPSFAAVIDNFIKLLTPEITQESILKNIENIYPEVDDRFKSSLDLIKFFIQSVKEKDYTESTKQIVKDGTGLIEWYLTVPDEKIFIRDIGKYKKSLLALANQINTYVDRQKGEEKSEVDSIGNQINNLKNKFDEILTDIIHSPLLSGDDKNNLYKIKNSWLILNKFLYDFSKKIGVASTTQSAIDAKNKLSLFFDEIIAPVNVKIKDLSGDLQNPDLLSVKENYEKINKILKEVLSIIDSLDEEGKAPGESGQPPAETAGAKTEEAAGAVESAKGKSSEQKPPAPAAGQAPETEDFWEGLDTSFDEDRDKIIFDKRGSSKIRLLSSFINHFKNLIKEYNQNRTDFNKNKLETFKEKLKDLVESIYGSIGDDESHGIEIGDLIFKKIDALTKVASEDNEKEIFKQFKGKLDTLLKILEKPINAIIEAKSWRELIGETGASAVGEGTSAEEAKSSKPETETSESDRDKVIKLLKELNEIRAEAKKERTNLPQDVIKLQFLFKSYPTTVSEDSFNKIKESLAKSTLKDRKARTAILKILSLINNFEEIIKKKSSEPVETPPAITPSEEKKSTKAPAKEEARSKPETPAETPEEKSDLKKSLEKIKISLEQEMEKNPEGGKIKTIPKIREIINILGKEQPQEAGYLNELLEFVKTNSILNRPIFASIKNKLISSVEEIISLLSQHGLLIEKVAPPPPPPTPTDQDGEEEAKMGEKSKGVEKERKERPKSEKDEEYEIKTLQSLLKEAIKTVEFNFKEKKRLESDDFDSKEALEEIKESFKIRISEIAQENSFSKNFVQKIAEQLYKDEKTAQKIKAEISKIINQAFAKKYEEAAADEDEEEEDDEDEEDVEIISLEELGEEDEGDASDGNQFRRASLKHRMEIFKKYAN